MTTPFRAGSDRAGRDPVPPSHEVVVVGSANVDVRLQVGVLPRPGETVLADGRDVGPGGKGANQAIAAARSGGARTGFLGALGEDAAATVVQAALDDAGVDTTLVRRTGETPTGTAYVVVEASGENLIVVDPGANATLVDLGPDERELLAAAKVVLCQLEVPLATIRAVGEATTGRFVLNAAPAARLPADLLERVDVLVVNEHEACTLAARPTPEEAIDALLPLVAVVIVTRGAASVLVAQRAGGATRRADVPVTPARHVVDTTGAGDTFCGVLAAELARAAELEAAILRAATAASLAVERPGAGAAAPTVADVSARLGRP